MPAPAPQPPSPEPVQSPTTRPISVTKPDPEVVPEILTIKDLPQGKFIVWGKPIGKYSSKLLAIGGQFPKKKIGEVEVVEDLKIIQFTGKKKLEEHREELLKPVSQGGYGGAYAKKKTGGLNKSIIEVRGKVLSKNRDDLENMGGKYLRKKTGGYQGVDRSKIKFDSWSRGDVTNIIFESLPDAEKYIAAYQKVGNR